MKRFVLIAPLYALLALVLACSVGTLSREEFDESHPTGRMTVLHERNMRGVPEALSNQVSSKTLRAHAIHAGPDFVSFELQDPRMPAHLDLYMLSDGEWQKPAPVVVNDPAAIGGELFDVDVEMLLGLANIARSAVEKVHVEKGHLASIYVSKSGGVLGAMVVVEGPRGSKSLRLDMKGALAP